MTALVAAATMLSTAPGMAQAPTATPRPDRIAGQPNFNGVWQALNTAYWNRLIPGA
jgi:hypothetical protein